LRRIRDVVFPVGERPSAGEARCGHRPGEGADHSVESGGRAEPPSC